MKIIFSVLLIAGGLIGWSQGSTQVPEAAQTDFNSRITTESTASWETVGNGFKVSYQSEAQNGILFYDEDGIFKASWDEVSFDQLLEETKAYIKDNYSKKDVVRSYLLNSNTAPERGVVILKIKGNRTTTVYFRPDGTFHYQE